MARPRRRRWPQRLFSTIGVFVITAFALSSAGVFYAKRTIDSVASVDLSSVLTPEGKSIDDAGLGPTTIENYLIVGSDSRADVNPDDPIRLSTAASLAFPDGSMTSSGLRKEALRGRLVIERIAGETGSSESRAFALRWSKEAAESRPPSAA